MRMAKKSVNPWPARCRRLRTKRGWTPEQLAVQLGIAPRTVYYYELGSQQPSRPVQLLIARLEAEAE